MLQKAILFTSPCLAGLIGLVVVRKLTLFYKLVLVQVVIYVCVLGITYMVEKQYIHLVYNIYLPVETSLLMGGGLVLFRSRLEKTGLFIAFVAFVIVYLLQTSVGIQYFANFASVLEGVIMMGVYLVIIRRQFFLLDSPFRSSPLLWLCLGGMIYFAGIIPLLSIFNFANRNFLAENDLLFRTIVDTLANIRYIAAALGFWLSARNNI